MNLLVTAHPNVPTSQTKNCQVFYIPYCFVIFRWSQVKLYSDYWVQWYPSSHIYSWRGIHYWSKKLWGQVIVTGLTGMWLSVDISGLSSSVVIVLAWYARGSGFNSRLRLDFSPFVVLDIAGKYITCISGLNNFFLQWSLPHRPHESSRKKNCLFNIYL